MYGVDGTLLDDQTANRISVDSQGVARNLLDPAVPAATQPPAPAQAYFVELLLTRHGQLVDRNVYWLSTQQDVVELGRDDRQPAGDDDVSTPTSSSSRAWAARPCA